MQLLVLVIVFVAGVSGTYDIIVDVLQNSTLPLTPTCQQQFEKFFANFSMEPNSWALQMIDATSKLPSGLLWGNFGEMGNFQQCIDVNAGEFLGKYCLGYLSVNANTTASNNAPIVPTWALCFPSGCATEDANVVGNALLASLSNQRVGVAFSDLLCQTTHEANPKLTSAAIITICILVVLLLTVVASTLYDIYCNLYGQKACPMIVCGFSAYTNNSKIFKMTTYTRHQLPCLNGLKFISMMWVLICHQFTIPEYGATTNSKQFFDFLEHLHSMFIASGTLSVDTFFTIGGALMAYGFMRAKQNKVPFNLFLYYLHRYLRLTAPFALVVLVSATLLTYMGSGPKWPYLKLYFQQNCEDYWWSALLYVQNYVNVSQMCVGQTWYLNIDFQLYLISPAVFYFLWKYPKTALICLVLCVAVFVAVPFYLAWHYELTAIVSNFNGNKFDFQNKYYLLTHTRAAPWIIGVILGYFIFKIKNHDALIKLNKWLVVISWVVCFGTMLSCIFGGHSTLRSAEYDKWGNAFHIALVRPVWSVSIAWIIFACSNNYGGTGPVNWILSLPIYQVFNRFTYSIYLTHVTLLYVIAYGRQWPDYFSNFNMTYEFWGTLWFTTGLAYLLVLTTESPIIVVEKLLLGWFGRKSRELKKKKDVEVGLENAAFQN